MDIYSRNVDIEPAVRDLRNRSLARLPGDFSRLIYLASSRDLSNGLYSHDGLAFHFGETTASEAMATCHREIFERLLFYSLEQLIEELESYISSTHITSEEVLKTWEKLQSYRVTIPLGCDELAAEFFISNVKMAVAILKARQKPASKNEQFS